MRIFVLEDDPERIRQLREVLNGHDLTVGTSVDEALDRWAPPYDLVLLDHDLGGQTFVDSAEENTGATFVRQPAVAAGLAGPVCIIHSLNYDGAVNMQQWVLGLGKEAVAFRVPFGEPLFTMLPIVLGVLAEEKEGELA